MMRSSRFRSRSVIPALALLTGVSMAAAGCASRAGVTAPDTTPVVANQAVPTDQAAQVSQYVRVQEALAADDFPAAKIALSDLVPLVDTATRPLAETAAGAEDIVTLRARFKPLSEVFNQREMPAGYAKAYCPMYDGGAPWIQKDGPIRNPYYGAAMLTCGVVDAAPGAHMDHSPRHGGKVFMAPDAFHHIEGAFPADGMFRLYATDNFREPVSVSSWSGRVVLEEVYDEASDAFKEIKGAALMPSADGAYLHAMVGQLPMPATITAKVVFQTGFPEERFDFIFEAYSTDGDMTPARTTGGSEMPTSIPITERIRPQIPADTDDIVVGISERDTLITELIGRGAFTEVFIPALQAKELALALMDRTADLPEGRRNGIRIAVRSLVRAAWLLDWYGDLGNKQQVDEAYGIFGTAVADIASIYNAP